MACLKSGIFRVFVTCFCIFSINAAGFKTGGPDGKRKPMSGEQKAQFEQKKQQMEAEYKKNVAAINTALAAAASGLADFKTTAATLAPAVQAILDRSGMFGGAHDEKGENGKDNENQEDRAARIANQVNNGGD